MRGSRIDYDRAYAAFAAAGVLALAVRGLSMLPLGTGAAGGVGILVALPLFLLGATALIAGIAWTYAARDDRVLLLLAGLGLLYLGNVMLEFVPLPYANAIPVVFGLVAVVGAAAWFTGRRRAEVS